MSEPVSNAQVEDVLASIRKLVSHDKRPARDPETEPTKAVSATEPADMQESKFVLAPAFRVGGETQPSAAEVTNDASSVADEARADAEFDAAELERGLEEQALLMSEQMEEAPAEDLDLGTHMDVEDAPATFDELEQVVVGIKDTADEAEFQSIQNSVTIPEKDKELVEPQEAPSDTAAIAFEHRSWGELAGSRLDDLAEESVAAVETDHTLASWYGQQGDVEDDETASSWDFISTQPEAVFSEDIDTSNADQNDLDDGGFALPVEDVPETASEAPAETAADEPPTPDPTADLQAKIAALEAVIIKQDAQLQTAYAVERSPIDLEEDVVPDHDHRPADFLEVESDDESSISQSADIADGEPVTELSAFVEHAAEDDPVVSRDTTTPIEDLPKVDPETQVEDVVHDKAEASDAEAELHSEKETQLEHVEEAAQEAAEVVQLSDAMSATPNTVDMELNGTVGEDAPQPGDPDPEEVDDAAAEAMLSADHDVLDEDVLRDLVSEIVRQELQGALGERITRNVRKLVRREIHRAMATQDLE